MARSFWLKLANRIAVRALSFMPSIVIAEISYDRMRARLAVRFVNGRTYEYVDVPAEVAASFQSAFSKVTFFNLYIRDRYDFKELVPAR